MLAADNRSTNATMNSNAVPFIGRQSELQVLCDLIPGTDCHRGAITAVAGEAGIGKTKLMGEFARIAESRGCHVIWSQLTEEPGAPPYFCWVLALRSSIGQFTDKSLSHNLGNSASDIASLMPELVSRIPIKKHKPAAKNIKIRFQLFDSVTRYLLTIAGQQPVVILLDNLHAADTSSLALLEYLSHHIATSNILITGAYRTEGLHGQSSLKKTLALLTRNSQFQSLRLEGMGLKDTAQMLHSRLGVVLPRTQIDDIHTRSGGNPLFITEFANMLATETRSGSRSATGNQFRIPDNLNEVLSERLSGLSTEIRSLLSTAALLGREFEGTILAALASVSPATLSNVLQDATEARIIEPLSRGRYQFRHVLFREFLYAEHNRISRVMLHHQAAQLLEAKSASKTSSLLSTLAYHYFEAAQLGREQKAIQYCQLAAEAADEQRAYDEAVSLWDRALQASELEQPAVLSRRYELLLARGTSEYFSGQLNDASTTLLKTAILAYNQQWWEKLAAALHLFQMTCQQSGNHHVASAPLHHAVLENLPSTEVAIRARTLTSLANAYRSADRSDLAVATFGEGLKLARAHGDKQLLLDCLRKGNWAIGRAPDTLREGLAISREAQQLAQGFKDPLAAMDSTVDMIFQLSDLGEMEEFEARLETLHQMAEQERQPHFRNILIGFQTALAILRGQWALAYRYAEKGVRQVPLLGVSGLQGRFAFQVFAIRKALGTLAELKPIADQIMADTSSGKRFWLPGQIALQIELGEHQSARDSLSRLGEIEALPNDDLRQVALIYLSEACISLTDLPRCRTLFHQLSAYRGLNATLPGTFMLGAVSGYLGELAIALGKHQVAGALFEEAIAMNSRMGAMPAMARAKLAYCRLLQMSQCPEDRRKMRRLAAEARGTAQAFQLAPLLAELDDSLTTASTCRLTARERELLRTIAEGLSNSDIADALHISHSTVATHLRNIFRKTGVANRTEAAAFARQTGLLEQK